MKRKTQLFLTMMLTLFTNLDLGGFTADNTKAASHNQVLNRHNLISPATDLLHVSLRSSGFSL
jgi:hypothetical protein